ncbi:MAG TPA: methionine biosynthesis protein MetW [Solirubrobacteraceae bacterium]
MTVYRELADRHGLAESHRAILAAVPRGARVLDVGCAAGHLAVALVEERGCSVVGLEIDPGAAATARARGFEVRERDAERDGLDAAGFDAVVFGDVLEHLREPAAVLRQAHAAPLAIVSLPNIAHWTARRALLRGRFPQEDFGLFDRTHLRFYTRATAHALAREAGFAVVEERLAGAPLPLESRVHALRHVRGPLVRRAPELLALQFVLTLQPRADVR